jgi:hypothetical protein
LRVIWFVDDQPSGVRGAAQEIDVHLAGAQQFMHQGQNEQPVGAWRNAQPFVCDGGISGGDRVDRHHLGAAFFQLAEADLDRVAVVVLGDAEEHEIFGVLPVGLTEFPERAADRIKPARRHIDRTEAAVRGVVWGAELLRPPAGQGLALVAPGEEGKLARVCGSRPR